MPYTSKQMIGFRKDVYTLVKEELEDHSLDFKESGRDMFILDGGEKVGYIKCLKDICKVEGIVKFKFIDLVGKETCNNLEVDAPTIDSMERQDIADFCTDIANIVK